MSSSRARYGTAAAGVVGTFVASGVLSWFRWVTIPEVGLLAFPVGAAVAPLVGGFAVGYRTTGTHQNAAIDGAVTGFLAGFLLGFVGTTVVLVGSHYHPSVSWTVTDLLARAGPAGLVLGVFFVTWGLVGGGSGTTPGLGPTDRRRHRPRSAESATLISGGGIQ